MVDRAHSGHARLRPVSIRAPRGSARPWLRSQRPVPRLFMRPLERFLRLEAGSAALLLGAAVAALVWSNLDAGSYRQLWTAPVALEVGPLGLEKDLRLVINDLLMAVFFYVVALEVKRELRFGSLRDKATAAVPVAASLGTMVGAAAAYLAVNLVAGGDPRGWAIPITTDLAFALGALGAVGRRAPAELRAFLLTLAVVDDLVTIAVIGLFYSGGLALEWLGVAAIAAFAVLALQRISVRSLAPYVVLAGVVWLGFLESGVHPTIAGVVLGFLTPAVALHAREDTGRVIGEQLHEASGSRDAEIGESTMLDTARLAREAVSPLARMEAKLHPWTAYLILPVFALANAGVPVSAQSVGEALASPVGLGIVLGLVVGAPLTGLLFAWGLVRGTQARLPDRLDWAAIAGMAPLKGIGFTVAIFVSVLAFEDAATQDQAKLAILIASVLAGAIGVIALLVRSRR